MRVLTLYLLALFSFPASVPSLAEDALSALKACGSGIVETVQTGDKVTLQSGEVIVLADIKAPEYWPKDAPYNSWPYGRASKQALADLVRGKPITLLCDRKPTTAFREKRAHILLADGSWLQSLLVSTGNAFFFPTERQAGITAFLSNAEKDAREGRLGMWRSGRFSVVSATSDELKTGWFQWVRGTVISAKTIGKTSYLNFGEDWRSDFTIQFPARIARELSKRGIDVETLYGRRIEARGWVEWSGGPKIILSHPDQMEVVDDELQQSTPPD